MAVSAIAALVALYQLRLCTLILAANNLLLSRSLASIERWGPPASQRFLPVYLFSDENLTTAAVILSFSLVTMVIFMILFQRKRVRIGPTAPAIPKPLLVAIGLYLVAYTGSAQSIFSSAYATDQQFRYDMELAGGHALICSLLLYEIVRQRLLGLTTARRAFLVMFVAIGIPHYMRGGTGLTTGYLTAAAILLLPRTGAARRLTNMVRIGAIISAVLAISFVVRTTRAVLYLEGASAISTSIKNAFEMENSREESSEGVESVANASQQAAHILMCITLYDGGNSRNWRSIYNVVEYTFIPSFFVRWFGWKRSIEAAWELAANFIHGGGINVLGEFYWNGGYLCVVIMATALSFFCALVDWRYRSSPFWLMMLCQFAPTFLGGYGYGFAQVSRGAINGLVVASIYWILSRLRLGGEKPFDILGSDALAPNNTDFSLHSSK
jgi:hypothetical protein